MKKERKPHIQGWLYKINSDRWEEYKNPISPVKVAIVADKVWENYCVEKLREMANILGFEIKVRKEISNYRTRHTPKLRVGRRTFYLLPHS